LSRGTQETMAMQRRNLLKIGGTMAAATLLPACGGGDDEAPLSTAEMLDLDATRATTLIRDRRLSAEQYVRALLDRAAQLEDLNAIITLNEAGALTAARAIDAAVAAGTRIGPLAGLVIVVKDNINVAGLPTTGGTPALANSRPANTAPTAQRLIDAGAIVLGKSNLHELAFGITSTNLAPFAQPVKNPYDLTRIPGGSSGGTAAAIAARLATCGLGTDTGGSTRVPAALCGIAGLRPSVGNGGSQRRYHDQFAVVPISRTRDTVGPMGRTVADVALLDSVITGTPLAAPIALSGLRLGVPASFWAGLDSSLAAVVNAARTKLTQAGAVLVEADTPGLFDLNALLSFPIALHEPIEDIPAYLAASGVGGVTLASIAAGVASPDVQGAFGAILADALGAAYPAAMTVHRPALQAQYARWFADNRLDAMLFPTTILPATAIDAVNGSGTVSINGGPPADTFGTYIRNTDPGSNAGIPGLSLPAGLTSGGLPVGLELDGPLGSDVRLLGIGLAIEALLGPIAAPSP
jgi:indoleacetamide hydrolase